MGKTEPAPTLAEMLGRDLIRLKRRCLCTWIGFPAPEREVDIVRSRRHRRRVRRWSRP